VNPDRVARSRAARASSPAPTPTSNTLRLLNYRALSKNPKGRAELARGPTGQLQWSHLAQTLADLACDLLGRPRSWRRADPTRSTVAPWNRLYVFQRYTSIGAGTTEVQKNIISEKAIKLPRK